MQPSQTELCQLLEQLSGGNPDAAIRIQIGRSVVYKGAAAESATNSLTAEQVTELSNALNLLEGAAPASKSALAISVNGENIYRSSAKEGVTLNAVQVIAPAVAEDELEPASTVGEVLEPELVEPEPEGAEPEVLASELAAIDTVEAEVDSPAPTHSVVTDAVHGEPEPEPEAEAVVPAVPAGKPVGQTLSGSEVFMLEMHEAGMAVDQTKQWLYDQFQELAQSQLVQTLQREGPQQTRNALTQIAKFSTATVEKGIADSIVALTKQYGSVQDTQDGKRFKYEAEKFDVTVRGTNHYTLSDKAGKTLFAFRHSPVQVQATSPCALSLSQRFEVIQAGTALTATQAKQAAKSGVEGLQAMAQNLAGLAPAGTHERLAQMQQQQAVMVAEALVNSKQAISTAAGKMFSGTQFQVFKTPTSLRVFAQDGRGELLAKVGDVVKGRMSDLDFAQTGKTAQMLLNSVQQQVHQNMHGSSAKAAEKVGAVR